MSLAHARVHALQIGREKLTNRGEGVACGEQCTFFHFACAKLKVLLSAQETSFFDAD